MKKVEIYCKNTQSSHFYPLGTSLMEISRDLGIQTKNRPCGALVNNQVKELSFCMVKPKQIEFFDMAHPDGMRMYARSLIFVLYVAVKETMPEVQLRIQNGISNGFYGELTGMNREVSESDIFTIKQEMNQLIEKNIPLYKGGY